LRALTVAERTALEQLARATSERVDRATRAKQLLAVADGASFTAAAHTVGRRRGDAVARLVARFNREGLAAVTPRHGGGPPIQYGAAERARILAEFHRPPDREQDGTATWSLTTLQRALHRAPDGLPGVSTATILAVLWEAGYTWQQNRTWCHTGTARRRRRDGTIVELHDPLAAPKKK
jgi:transposase